MVSEDLEMVAMKVLSELLDSPDKSEAFAFCRSIVALSGI